MVPKPGLYQRGLLKSLTPWAILALGAMDEELACCFYLSLFISFVLRLPSTLTPIQH